MKLRRISALRYCDDDTGTYFDFWDEVSDEQALKMIELHQRCQLTRCPTEEYFGTNQGVGNLGKRRPRGRKRPPQAE